MGRLTRTLLVRRVRKRFVIAIVAALVVTAVVVVSRQNLGDDGQAGTVAAATSTATVTRRDLVVTEDVTGTLGYANERDLGAHRSGVVTSLAAQGSTVRQGKTLYAVDLEPTVLLTGAVPAYRSLSTDSANGPDVRQLEKALVALGYGDDLTVDTHFTSATAAAVKDWEQDLGRDDPDGTVTLGDVVFAPGPLRISSQMVSVGTQVQDTTAVLAISGGDKVVDVDLDVGKSDLVAPKDVVAVRLPNGKETKGTVASIGTQTQTASADPTADPTVPMVVRLTHPQDAADFDSGSITVTIEQSRDDDVTVVPVTALVALAEGGYAVQVVDPAQPSGYRLMAAKTGTITEDYAAVSGDGVREGLKVVVPA